MTGKLKLVLLILFAFILLGSAIFSRPDVEPTYEEISFSIALGLAHSTNTLEPLNEDKSANLLLPTDHNHGAIKMSRPRYPQNPTDSCNRKAHWNQVVTVPCGSVWGG